MTEVCKIHGNILINECYQCGAPVCCPSCCNEATRQPEAEQSAGKERKPAVTQWLSTDEIDRVARMWDGYPIIENMCRQAREANRLRAGLEVLHKDVEAMGLGLLYLRISELLEGEE